MFAAVLAFGAHLARPATSEAAAMCQICPSGLMECPADLAAYDLLCQNACGFWTYAGACREGPNNDCSNGATAVVCYEPM